MYHRKLLPSHNLSGLPCHTHVWATCCVFGCLGLPMEEQRNWYYWFDELHPLHLGEWVHQHIPAQLDTNAN